MNKKNITEVIGWLGAIAILIAYILTSFKVISTNDYLYQLLNLAGAIGIMIISIVKKVKQSITLNAIWAIIAIVAIINLTIHR